MKKNKLHEIIQELKKENLQDIERLYENYAQTVKNIAFSVLKDAYDSEDVMQEVFVKIHKMERKNLPNTGEWNWIYLVTKNTAIDFIKKRKKTICIEEIYNYKNTNDEIEKFISKTSCEKLFVNLSEKEKEILTLKIFSGFSFKEIGLLTNYPTSTVSWKYYKSMDILKSNIKKEFISLILIMIYILINSYKPKGSEKIYLKNGVKVVTFILILVNGVCLIKNRLKNRKKTIKKSSNK